jgi:hypothetical protein
MRRKGRDIMHHSASELPHWMFAGADRTFKLLQAGRWSPELPLGGLHTAASMQNGQLNKPTASWTFLTAAGIHKVTALLIQLPVRPQVELSSTLAQIGSALTVCHCHGSLRGPCGSLQNFQAQRAPTAADCIQN